PDELGQDFGESFVASLCPAILNDDGSILDPAEVAQPLHESVSRRPLKRRVICPQEPDGRQLPRLLRARSERPRGRCAAEQRDKRTALHSITSLARSRNDSGIVSPSALAVVRLIIKSNLVGCSIGMSPGFVPRRILST